MSMLRKLLVLAIFVGLLVGGWRLAGSNAQLVQVDYVVGRCADVALWKALLASAAVGGLLAALPLGFGWARARLETRRYRKALRRREAELQKLRGGEGEEGEERVGSGGPEAGAPGEGASAA